MHTLSPFVGEANKFLRIILTSVQFIIRLTLFNSNSDHSAYSKICGENKKCYGFIYYQIYFTYKLFFFILSWFCNIFFLKFMSISRIRHNLHKSRSNKLILYFKTKLWQIKKNTQVSHNLFYSTTVIRKCDAKGAVNPFPKRKQTRVGTNANYSVLSSLPSSTTMHVILLPLHGFTRL